MMFTKFLCCTALFITALATIGVAQPPSGTAADGIKGLYEKNLLTLAEYNCSIEMITLERKNIINSMNGIKPGPTTFDPLISKATDCANTIGYSFAYFSRAKAYTEKGDTKNALIDYEKAISVAKTESGPLAGLSEIYEHRADLYVRLLDRAKAEADLREAIRVGPGNTSAKDKLSELDKKIAEARKAAALANPQTAADFLIVGTEAYNRGKSEAAVQAFDRAIGLEPSSAAYLGKAKALRDLKRSDAAVLELNKAAGFGPNDPEVLEWRGRVYSDLKRWDEAVADLTKAIAAGDAKRKSDLLHARGAAYAGKGAYDAALKDESDAVLASDNAYAKVNALTGKARALQGLGKIDEALTAYAAAIAAPGDDYFAKLNLIDAYLERGRLYASQGKTDLAKADFNEIIKLAPSYAQQAKAELAKLIAAEAASAAAPKTAEQWAAEGRYAANEKKLDEAIRAFTECINLAAQPACYAFRGTVEGLKGDVAASKTDFDKAISLAPKEPVILFLRGQMNAQLGNKADAIADFRSVLKLAPGNAQATNALQMLGEKP